MFLRIATLTALLFAPFHQQAPAQSETSTALPSAREIVDRHVKAVGGREAIMAHKSMHATGTLAVPASGISGPLEIFTAANPDRVVLKASIQGIGEIAEGFDGTHAWSVNPMTGPTLKSGKELEQTKLDADFYGELRDPKSYTLKTLEKITFDNRPCYKVSVKRASGTEDFDYYDAATGLRAGTTQTRETQMGTVTVTTTEGDYKKFGKLLQATTVTQVVMGVQQKITLEAVDYDAVSASAFELPAAIKALIK